MASLGRVNFDEFQSSCGTYLCLAGWAASDQHFMRQGLRLRGGRYVRPYYSDDDDLTAIRCFFGLDRTAVRRLFGPAYMGDLATRRHALDEVIESRVPA